MDAQLQADLNNVIEKLRRLNPYLTKGPVKRNLAQAAKPMVSAVKNATPVGRKEHSRKTRAGQVITYKPGNLRKSMRVLRFRRSEAVFVGPKLGKTLPDGYYAHIVEGRQRFFSPAVEAAKGQVLQTAVELFKRDVDQFGQKNGFK